MGRFLKDVRLGDFVLDLAFAAKACEALIHRLHALLRARLHRLIDGFHLARADVAADCGVRDQDLAGQAAA